MRMDRERDRERERNTTNRKSKARIRTTAAEFIFSRKDCVYEIIIDFVSWQLFICLRLVPIAIYY